MSKKGRGFVEQYVSGDGEVILTHWFDNKSVVMTSNFMGVGKEDECIRWDKNNNQYVSV